MSQLRSAPPFALAQARNVSNSFAWAAGRSQNEANRWSAIGFRSEPKPIAEFEPVRLLARIRRGDHVIPAGSIGVVIYIHRGGEAYEVEFSSPHPDVITLKAPEITRYNG